MKQLFVTSILGLAALAATAANPPLRIYGDSGKPDTVSRQTYYLVGITSPGAEARGSTARRELPMYIRQALSAPKSLFVKRVRT